MGWLGNYLEESQLLVRIPMPSFSNWIEEEINSSCIYCYYGLSVMKMHSFLLSYLETQLYHFTLLP